MKNVDIKIGSVYSAKISGQLVPIRILAANRYGHWDAKNIRTGRTVIIRSGRKLRQKWDTENKKWVW